MEGSDGLTVIEKIAAHDYTTFGMLLLQDDDGDRIELIKKNHRQEGAEGMTEAIIRQWRKDGRTCTYKHLIKCLRDCKLGTLADFIAERIRGRPVHSTYIYYRLPIIAW